MLKTFVVTGGAGFIGSHITERLLRDGHKVRVIDNFSTGFRHNLTPLAENPEYRDRLSIHEIDLTDLASLPPIFEGVDTVFHHAALASVPLSVSDPLSTHHHCVTATLHVLIAARDAGVRRVVYAASSAAYGDVEAEYQVETMIPDPKSPYGAAKLFGEYYAKVFYEVYGLETVCLRYFNVFGTRQDPTSHYAAVIPIFVSRLLKGEAPIIHGDGSQSRDFIYIDNVVHGNLLASTAPDAPGHVLNMATGSEITILELAKRLDQILGTNISPIHDAPREGDIKHSQANIDLAGQILGYEPIVDFDTGLRRTVEWFKTEFTK